MSVREGSVCEGSVREGSVCEERTHITVRGVCEHRVRVSACVCA